MSARIMDTITSSCSDHPHYCKVLLDILREEIGKLEPDSTSTLMMENFHNVICVSLLKNKQITTEDLRTYLGKVSKNELKEVNSLTKGQFS